MIRQARVSYSIIRRFAILSNATASARTITTIPKKSSVVASKPSTLVNNAVFQRTFSFTSLNHSPFTVNQENVQELVFDTVAKLMQINESEDKGRLTLQTHMESDLGMDVFKKYQLFDRIEREIGVVDISIEAADKAQTLGDIVDLVYKTPITNGRLVQLEAIFCHTIQENVIIWEDIRTHFPKLRHVKSGSTTISYARDKNCIQVSPICIRLYQEGILNVELDDDPDKDVTPKIGLGQFPAVETFPFVGSRASVSNVPTNRSASRFSTAPLDPAPTRSAIENMREVILRQNYQLAEFRIPRLFIIVPKLPVSSLHSISTAIWGEQLTLHFLCECGMHNDSEKHLGNSTIPKFHLAKHEGYDLQRPKEFFEKYGHHVLKLLRILQASAAAGCIILPALSHFGVTRALDTTAKQIENTQQIFQSSIRFTLDYLWQLGVAQNIDSSTSSLPSMQALEGADLRQLKNFLRRRDEPMELGNLYRTFTPNGDVEWVCSDHYTPITSDYRDDANKHLEEFVKKHDGKFGSSKGKICITLTEDLAKKFYAELKRSKGVQDLEIQLNWKVHYSDLCELETAMKLSNIVALDLSFLDQPKPPFSISIHSRSSAILRMMANHRLQVLTVRKMDGFLHRSPHANMEMQIRTLNLGDQLIEEKYFGKLQEVLRLCTSLSKLSLLIQAIDAAFETIKKVPACYNRLLELDLQQREKATAVRIVFKGTPVNQNIDQIRAVNIINSISLDTVDLGVTQLSKSPKVHQVVLHCERDSCHNKDNIRSTFKHLFQNFPELKVLGLRCCVSQFFQFYLLAMESGVCASLRAIQFGDRYGNELTVYDIDQSDKFLASLPMISLTRKNVLAHDEHESMVALFSNFGWKIKALEIDHSFTVIQANALSQSSQSGSRLHLDSLTWDITEVTNHDIFVAISKWLQNQNPGKTPAVMIRVYLDSKDSSPVERMLDNLGEHNALWHILSTHMTHLTIFGERSHRVVEKMISNCEKRVFSKVHNWSLEKGRM
ncbi:hypothetical protein BGX21_000674 [Mortierella sp. AD011]|nr:hypothetical protein BGX20_011502 [Mortierella sp. AD010]KAF9401770.1 hypothetical protein BGX21_000674 [Mortierella sp. AD011]